MTDKEEKDIQQISAWGSLGHPAFDNEFLFSLESVEWWEQGLQSDDIINS
jgi:hypothetical protein